MEMLAMGDDSSSSKGGQARAKSLSPKKRSEIAQNAARARHDVVRATHGAADQPLKIGNLEIPCYVLEDGRRVLSLGGMIKAMGMTGGSAGGGEGDRLGSFASGKSISPFISEDLSRRMRSPIRFRAPTGGSLATGYEATILPELCDAVLAARKAGSLMGHQRHIAEQCEVLVRGLARVGIIALVDEATGYQADRARDALAKILETFIAKELQAWVQTFPADYYRELFRLRGLPFPTDTVKRPQYFGILTNDIVYKRIAPGVLDELKRVTPKDEETGRLKHKLFQRLTSNAGYPKLREHLGAVVAVMKLSTSYSDFINKLDHMYPRFDDTLLLPFEYRKDDDDGKGI
jgi:hypothetical protein